MKPREYNAAFESQMHASYDVARLALLRLSSAQDAALRELEVPFEEFLGAFATAAATRWSQTHGLEAMCGVDALRSSLGGDAGIDRLAASVIRDLERQVRTHGISDMTLYRTMIDVVDKASSEFAAHQAQELRAADDEAGAGLIFGAVAAAGGVAFLVMGPAPIGSVGFLVFVVAGVVSIWSLAAAWWRRRRTRI